MLTALALLALLQSVPVGDVREIVGTWQGTSTCTDRVAAPACSDEVAVYEIADTATRGVARL